MNELGRRRREKQPLEYPSAGSTFKRPEGYFAGKLIEDSGLKGYAIGGAQVSEKHAGFVINRGGATEADIRRLSQEVRRIVFEKTGYLLECEIRPMTGDPI
jgi:UDP-N-acetylmuramate dehydrogenase